MKTLSQYWLRIQGTLSPWLEKELEPLTEKQQQLVTVLEIARIEQFIRHYDGCVGVPQKDRCAIARAFVAKAIYNMTTTRMLLERIQTDKSLRRICGWERKSQVPSGSTFSRAFAEFAKSELPQHAHETLIQTYCSERLIGHISRDATAIEAREKVCVEAKERAKKKKNEAAAQVKFKRGRPKKGEIRPPKEPKRLKRQQTMSLEEMLKDLPKGYDIGTKPNSKGRQESWRGYKLHIDTADGAIPISAILTSASVHDGQVALPLATLTAKRVTNCYDLMDPTYDAVDIREHSASLGHVPLIAFNRRGPHDQRDFTPHEAQRYKERSTAERVNGRLKDEFGGVWFAFEDLKKSWLTWASVF